MAKSTKNIMDNLIGQKPSMVAWRLSTRDIEDFIFNYLTEAGIRGVKRPAVLIDKEGTNSNIGVSAFAFFSVNSEDVIDNGRDVENSIIREYVAATRYKPTKKLREVLSPIACYDKQNQEYNTNLQEADRQAHVLFIRLDVIRILSSMLCAPRNQYQIAVMQAINTGRGEGQLYVAKQENYGGSGNSENDLYRDIARGIARRSERKNR